MSDSAEKRQRERKKREKKREKEVRKQERKRDAELRAQGLLPEEPVPEMEFEDQDEAEEGGSRRTGSDS